MDLAFHTRLACGAELAVLHLPSRRAEALEIRLRAGMADEPAEQLGLAHLVEQTVDKGTAAHDGRGLADAFDQIGASHTSWCGRELSGFNSLCLPEYFDRNVELHAEMIRRPTFPEDSCKVAVDLSRQELLTLEDDPQALADKLIVRQAFGPVLGRHSAGEAETLDRIGREDFVSFWKRHYRADCMQVTAAGPLTASAVAEAIERHFTGFGAGGPTASERFAVQFDAVTRHHPKETEQEQIAIALAGVPRDHDQHAAETILVRVLSGGMSSRLFTEVREKQGLVYWVGAWQEYVRGAGLVFVGASTTPQRCDQTFDTLLRELDRAAKDVTEEEIERALTGIVVRADIRNDVTRAQCLELADDLVFYGRPVPWAEKLARLQAVTIEDIRRYCRTWWRRNGLSVVTLGERALGQAN